MRSKLRILTLLSLAISLIVLYQLVQTRGPFFDEDYHLEDPVDICMVIGGLEPQHEIPFFINSLLSNSRDNTQFAFHIMVDDRSKQYTQSIFENIKHRATLELLEIDVEQVSNYIKELDPNHYKDYLGHHSGIYGVSKLMLFKLFPKVEKCIIMDTDLVFGDDINKLNALFSDSNDAIIQMTWQKDGKHSSLINSGVMLVDFKGQRKLDTDNLYRSSIETINNTKLNNHGDQSIVYKLFRLKPELFSKLDSYWNAEFCHEFNGIKKGDRIEFGIVHFNCVKGKNEMIGNINGYINNFPDTEISRILETYRS